MSRRTISDRVTRARSMDREYWIVDRSPMVVRMASSSDPDTEYTIVPNTAYCSCEDRQYRQYPCKHLLHLALCHHSDSALRETVVSGFEHHHEELVGDVHELERELDEARSRRDVWEVALDAIDDASVLDADGIVDDALVGAQRVSVGGRRDERGGSHEHRPVGSDDSTRGDRRDGSSDPILETARSARASSDTLD